MAHVDLTDIIATTDGDTTWGADMRDSFTTLAADRLQLPMSFTRGSGMHRTPTREFGTVGTIALSPGQYGLALHYVYGGYTPATVVLGNVGTLGATSSNAYFVIANILSTDGLPGTIAASWGPFDCTTTGTKTLTSQSTAMPDSGWYWVGGMIANSSASSATVDSFATVNRMFCEADERNYGIVKSGTGHNSPADLSAVTGWASTRFASTPHVTMS